MLEERSPHITLLEIQERWLFEGGDPFYELFLQHLFQQHLFSSTFLVALTLAALTRQHLAKILQESSHLTLCCMLVK